MITMKRDVDLAATEVCVYKNLNRGGWSITAVKGNDNRGLLLAHADEIVLHGARAVVKESRRQVIAAGGHREVCAWFVGKIITDEGTEEIPQFSGARVTFRPREQPAFFRTDTGDDVSTADRLWFDEHGNAWICECTPQPRHDETV
jgi:hypothetical protein